MVKLKFRGKLKRKYNYVLTNVTIPAVTLKAYTKLKKVMKFGKGGVIPVPGRFVGKEFYMILIPQEDVDED